MVPSDTDNERDDVPGSKPGRDPRNNPTQPKGSLMTRHQNTNTLTVNSKTMDIVRRRGNKVRFFDPATARMSKWVTLSPSKPKTPEATPSLDQHRKNLARMSKVELQELAGSRKPAIPFNTKTTKAALIEALTA